MSGLRALLAAFVAAMVLAPPATHAVPIFKCRAPDGALSYRDTPCPPGTDEQAAPRIAPPPPYVPPPPEPSARREPRTDAGDVEPVRDVPPPPALFRCYDGETGKSYVSDTPRQNLRYVPLWTVLPGDAFANVGRPPPQPSPRTPAQGNGLGWAGAASQYTAVEDRCREMGLAEMCGYWSQHVDEVRSKRRLAFKDTRGALEQEEADLRGLLATHCNQ